MKILITGGFGFIGTNAAKYFATLGHEIFILDNLSRKGNFDNYIYLQSLDLNIRFLIKDIRNYNDLIVVFQNQQFDSIIHLAAQVAVTTSVIDPRLDFEINCLGTFNILECCRLFCPNASFLYASTNKVYGEFDLMIDELPLRYNSKNFTGINEIQPLDFHSPYGCSKGCGDQYVIDYSRIYNMKTVCLRQSCIYGPNQFGIEDQGWVSWFGIASIFDKPITIYGSGKQVRDVLFIYDLLKLYHKLINNIDKCIGQAYNIGGGLNYTLSLLELVDLLSNKLKKNINCNFTDWRPGDQKIYISNIDKIYNDIGWFPETQISNGLDDMLEWLCNNQNILKNLQLI